MLRTTFITGFPGETDEQFEELVEFVRQQRFERMGVFTYSFEADTPAARLPDHLARRGQRSSPRAADGRAARIAFAWNAAQVGKRMDVLLDAAVPGEKNAWVGRGYADAPDVDGVVFVTGKKLKAGDRAGRDRGHERLRSGGRRRWETAIKRSTRRSHADELCA